MNVKKVLSAPVTVIIAHDMAFYDQLDTLFAHAPDAHSMFVENPELTGNTAFRNGSLQGAYLMIAARAVGLDVGPMSGFDNQALDQEFFADSNVKSNFLCSLGYGDTSKIFQRLPRLEFDQICHLI